MSHLIYDSLVESICLHNIISTNYRSTKIGVDMLNVNCSSTLYFTVCCVYSVIVYTANRERENIFYC